MGFRLRRFRGKVCAQFQGNGTETLGDQAGTDYGNEETTYKG